MNPVNGLVTSLERLGNMPLIGKIAFSGFSGATIIGLAFLVFSGNKMAVMILTVGMIAVFGLIVLYQGILKLIKKRKASPLTQGIAGNAAAAPQGISEPARRARLDDLRRNFEQGVEKFRAAGKNLYSVPWYVLVGEPGSGKTEAIRHCNVGFPPGLQDQLQGAGGTLNMNWWFTNQAIILDTAGRLMFEEVAPGSTNEWQEFLKLLKGNRPNCPINGMLLVIPVDTLIKDTADSIEKKATKIAQQFDQIQRTLGVRFPVFIIITKCDLLNGFREFFDDLNDPQLQHQIMGWSNPANLDERFDPHAVTTHLEVVKQRLTERRTQLLLDPVNTEDAQGRRVDQVDALYALPDSITKIAPRLKRYLELIFVAGEWAPKPLFLRGIYFTSSMTEGSALDAELAEVLGVSVDALPEGKVWRRDRAYFLRDLFIEKVFREKGLVTRADNADKLVRTRRAIVMTCGFLAVIILGTFTFLGYRQLQKSIGIQRSFWTDVADKNRPGTEIGTIHIIDPEDKSYQNPKVKVLGVSKPLATFFDDTAKSIQENIQVPFIFKPLNFVTGDINDQRRAAFRLYYEATVLSPVYNAAREKIKSLPDDKWTNDDTLALEQLMKPEYTAATGKIAEVDHPQVEVAPLFRVALAPDSVKLFEDDKDHLQRVADAIYAPENGPKIWPDAVVHPDNPDLTKANLKIIDTGVQRTISYWKRQRSAQGEHMGAILTVQSALDDFRKAEDYLATLKTKPVNTLADYNSYVKEWNATLARIQAARDTAARAWTIASKDAGENPTLKDLYTAEINRVATDAQSVYNTLLKLTPDPAADPNKPADTLPLASSRQSLNDALKDLDAWKTQAIAKAGDFEQIDNAYLAQVKSVDDSMRPRFLVQAQLYELADRMLVKGDAATQPAATANMAAALASVDSDVNAADDRISIVTRPASSADRLDQAGKIAMFTVDVGARRRRYDLVHAILAPMPGNDTDKWFDYVAQRAAAFPTANMLRPSVPLVTFADKSFPARYSPDAVGYISDSLKAINDLAKDPANVRVLEPRTLIDAARAKQQDFNAYLDLYLRYWKEEVFADLNGYSLKSWTDFANAIASLRERSVRSSLEDFGQKVQDALNKVGHGDDANAIQQATLIGQKRDFQSNCSDMISYWSNLGDNYRQCRRQILAMDPRSFMNNYSVDTGSDDGFVAHYWQHFTVEAIRVIAAQSQDDIFNGLKELEKYERFPLAPLTPSAKPEDDLQPKDLAAARAALDRVAGSAAAPAGGVKSIGLGTPTKNKDVDLQLDALRGTNLLRGKLDYIAALQKFFAALPTDASQPLTVSLSVVKEHLTDDNSVSQKYHDMPIVQGKTTLSQAYLQGKDPDKKADVQYPGDELSLQFRETPDGPIIQSVPFPGPWAVFRLLADKNVQSVKRDGTKWTINYTLTDPNKKQWSLYLLLDFKAEVPDLKDWPKPPATPQ
ncbi:MAG: type VI secretion protein IcmF/TssM N-terminal domain-containing protein [Phycisphaerae bacterium]